MITHYEGRGGYAQAFDSCVIVQIDEIQEVSVRELKYQCQPRYVRGRTWIIQQRLDCAEALPM